ncbi:MAG TPA: transglutaminaseTgpA domain-containing protein [Gaiellaceae bacterium]|nr:transglutaminaseTgpA domain-containing protein [Gaiellaceae bacterium]
MARALLVVGLAAPLFAWSWMRLESGGDLWQAAVVVVLALVPVLVRGSARVLAVVVTLLLAGAIAFDTGAAWGLPGTILGRFGNGFLEFYDVQVPFARVDHPHMHGVLLLAVYAFTLTFALAVSARRPVLAALVLLVGVGWPGTLLPGHDLVRGALLLAAVLATIALLRRQRSRSVVPALAAGAVVIVAALAATTSPALAKRAFLDWQHWDLYTKPARPVDVSYVWNSSYSGLTFRGKPTTVFTVKASPQAHYWRVSVLNTVQNGRWYEEVSPEYGPAPVPLGEEGLIPLRQRQQDAWEKEQVTIGALRDVRLPGGSEPMRFESGNGVGDLSFDPTGVAFAKAPLSRGDSYDVWSFQPSPTPNQLAASKPVYSGPIVAPEDKYREVQPRVYPRLFGRAGGSDYVDYLMTRFARAEQLRPFIGLYRQAEQVAGGARSPYAAAVALERWFRYGGGFTYDQHPPPPPAGVPALEDFVVHTRRGYCQHFAGAMALMLRYLGIPSRVAVGFTSGEYDSGKGEWIVSDRDAHMWVEVWFRGWGWVPFDPTPSRGGLAGSYSASSSTFDLGAAAAVLAGAEGFGVKQFGDKLANTLGFGTARTSPDVPELGTAQPGVTLASHRHHDWGILRLLLFGVAGVLVVLTLTKLAVRGSRFLTSDPRRLAGACRKELRDFLRDQGLEVPASATLRELAALVEDEFRVEAQAFGLHATAARFAPQTGAREASRAMRRDLRALRKALRKELSRGERVRGLLSLRSLGLA